MCVCVCVCVSKKDERSSSRYEGKKCPLPSTGCVCVTMCVNCSQFHCAEDLFVGYVTQTTPTILCAWENSEKNQYV